MQVSETNEYAMEKEDLWLVSETREQHSKFVEEIGT